MSILLLIAAVPVGFLLAGIGYLVNSTALAMVGLALVALPIIIHELALWVADEPDGYTPSQPATPPARHAAPAAGSVREVYPPGLPHSQPAMPPARHAAPAAGSVREVYPPGLPHSQPASPKPPRQINDPDALSWWETLNTERYVNSAELKRAFWQAAKHNHPDHGGTDRQMQAVNAAYEAAKKDDARFLHEIIDGLNE
jgi:hypothetical protein